MALWNTGGLDPDGGGVVPTEEEESMIRTLAAAAGLALLSAGAAGAAPLLYSIGPDSALWGPSGFYSVSTTPTATWLANLGDGSLGFNGGLAYHAGEGRFYAVSNDSFGYSGLVSFTSTGGSFSTGPALADHFTGGLAYNSSNGSLYGIANDSAGLSTLYQIGLSGTLTLVGSLGTGFSGGLTYNPATGLLYAFSADGAGVQREFQAIDPLTGTVSFLFELGDGSVSFNGGVAYGAAGGAFYVISNSAAGSELQTLDLTGALTNLGALGNGFWNAGLALGVDGSGGTTVPEPAMWQLVAAGLLAVRLLRPGKRA